MSEQELVHKITLGTGKVVLLREMKLKYQNLALQTVGNKAKDNMPLLGSLAQQELLKMLVVSINTVKVTAKDLEKLDDHFTYPELLQMMQVLEKVTGGSDMGEFQTEIMLGGVS